MNFINCKPKWLLIFILLASQLTAQPPRTLEAPSIWLQGDFGEDEAELEFLNYNKTLLFNGEDKVQLAHEIKAFQQATIFTVYKNESPELELPVWGITGEFGEVTLSTKNVSNEKGKYKMPYAKEIKSEDSNNIATVINTYKRSRKRSEIADELPAILTIGRSGSPEITQGFRGSIAEFILYERILNPEEVSRLESYLAIKFGVTLQKDYLNSVEQKIWNHEKNKEYSNHIGGIGRDDTAGLYQVKSSADNNPDQLMIGVAPKNNTGQKEEKIMGDMTYLLWGDNGEQLNLANIESEEEDLGIAKKKWLINAAGAGVYSLPSFLEIKIQEGDFSVNNLSKVCLLIDRSGKGDFSWETSDIIPQSRLPINGNLRFDKITWNKEGAQKEAFTFGIPPDHINVEALQNSNLLEISFSEYPNPTLDGHFQLSIKLKKVEDVKVKIFDSNQRLLEVKTANGQANYEMQGFIDAGPGAYTIVLETAEGNIARKIILE